MRAHLLTTTAAVALLAAVPARAQDATWLLNPSSGDFNTAANWNPATVPTRTAFFGATNTPNLTLNSPFSIFTEIGGFTFNAGASNYTLANPTYSVTVNGAGIVINGGSATFNLGTPPTGSLAQAPFIFHKQQHGRQRHHQQRSHLYPVLQRRQHSRQRHHKQQRSGDV
jgi:hypothetical protein